MMKKRFFLLGMAFLVLLSCGGGGGKDYTYEELQIFDELTPLGTPFWEEFGYLQNKYNLTDSESKVLGEWTGFKKQAARAFTFYPNGLFMVRFGASYKYKAEEDRYLTDGYGIWEVRDDMLVATIYKFRKLFHPEGTGVKASEYFDIAPYEVPLININDVASGGYTRKPFKHFVLPKDLRSKVNISSAARKRNVMVRSIYVINPLVLPESPKRKMYGYLKVVPDMAADNVSGLDVATSTELVKKYFENLVF
jgi:hypothetical protein